MQSDTFFVTLHEGLQWGSIECHTEHPFIADRNMVWDSTDGLVEVGHTDGLREPLLLIMEVDAMSLQLVYEHLGNEFVVGWQCPVYVTEDDIEYKDVHMRSPQWGRTR
jgi:hypothetical protein